MAVNLGQINNDELQVLIKSSTDKKKKMEYAHELAERIWQSDTSQALVLFRDSMLIAQDLREDEREFTFLHGQAKCLLLLSQYEDALNLYLRCLPYYERIQNWKKREEALNGIGTVYYEVGVYDRALEYYKRSLEVAVREGNLLGQARTSNNLGLIFIQLECFAEAKSFFIKCLNKCDALGMEEGKLYPLQNLVDVCLRLGEYKEAESYITIVSEKNAFTKNPVIELSIMCQRAALLEHVGKVTDSFILYESALKIAEGTGNRYNECRVAIQFGVALYRSDRKDTALELIKRAEKIATELNSNKLLVQIFTELTEMYESLGKFENALLYHKKAVAIDKSASIFEAKRIVRGLDKERFLSEWDLSPRECQILSLLLDGKATKDIATELCLSSRTVENHTYRIFKRMHVSSRNEAITLFYAM
ncbi:MAG: LuxR family transcriptional regulator [Spirochaetes bacterium]|nr:LuxR family transcriptional regulator [Spirochaetota bacterium]MBU0954615.1 LuxR family transcriptional regulator [Spirochaetota bacterium]